MSVGIAILVVVLCLLTEGFFSGSEIGVVSADRIKLRHKAAGGSRGARLALDMLKEPEWLLSTTLVGTNVSVVTNTTVMTALAIQILGPGYGWVAALVATPLIWIFGEIVAKGVFQQKADTLTPRVIFVLRFASYLFFPILVLFSSLTRLISRTVGGGNSRNPFTLREEIVFMMDMSAATGDILPTERKMIRRVFRFSETTAADIMTPLIDVYGVEQGQTCKEVKTLAKKCGHKRLTVYDQRVDRVVGTLDALDLLHAPADSPIENHLRPARYIPGAKGVVDLLLELRGHRDKIAVVVDEFGGAQGIISLEDILEEVVGDIEDEYDVATRPTQWAKRIGPRHYVVSARIEIGRLKEETTVALPDGNYETLAGFLLDAFKDIPAAGTSIQYRNTTFTIEKASPQAILEVRIEWP